MRENHLWNRAKTVKIQTGSEIVGNFDIGFASKIPETTQDALMDFVYWVEDNFSLPITLWVDFKYNHYLLDESGKRVGNKFYWAKLTPVFDNPDDIPVIELPVRTERSTIQKILTSFIEAITMYFQWLTGAPITKPDANQVKEVLEAYLQEKRGE